MRISLSFTHCLELIPESHKSSALTFINVFDQISMVWFAMILKFIDPDMEDLYKGVFFLGIVTALLYILLIPESPRWEFLKDPRSAKGIEIINYIAAFNGSQFRVPPNAIMDVLGQLLIENKTVMNTKQGDVKL